MKRFITALVLLVSILSCLILTSCDDGKDYECGYCGRKMGHYYSYIGNRYTCYSCTKALRD